MRTYTIFQNHGEQDISTDTVVGSGLSWEQADKRRSELRDEYRAANPNKTSWSGDVFWIAVEPPEAVKAAKKASRAKKRERKA